MKPVTNYLSDNPIFTLLAVLVVIAGLAGAIIAAVNPEALTFEQYLDNLGKFAIALGTYAIGKGIFSGASRVADAAQETPLPLDVSPISEAEAEAAFHEAAVPANEPVLVDAPPRIEPK